MNQCNCCIWWAAEFHEGQRQFGRCSNSFVIEMVRPTTDIEVVASEDNFVYTDSCFSCGYNEPIEKAVTLIELPLSSGR